MTQSATFSQLSTTLEQFNNALDESDKLDGTALKTIQRYLNDPAVTILNKDEKKIQRALKELELLNDQKTVTRVSLAMHEINRQLINLAKSITNNEEKIKKNSLFVIVKLEVCFLQILSEEALDYNKQRQQQYEEKWNKTESFKLSQASPRSHALYMDHQQPLINELMNAALFDVIKYFRNENKSFNEHVTEKFLDSLSDIAENKGSPQDPIIKAVYNILTETAKICKLPMPFLISNLQYAIIGFDERPNAFTIPLKTYIRSTKSPSLREFNKTIGLSSALSSDDVVQFEPLFQLYCKILVPQRDGRQGEPDVPVPPIECESDLKFIWVTPNVQDYYKDFEKIILPASVSDYTAKELTSETSPDWKDCRVFLCLNAKNARDLLPDIHKEKEFYRIYVICQNQAEEDEFQPEKNKFNKIRAATNNKQVLIRQLALDIVDSFIDLRNLKFKNKDYVGANRWYEAAIKKVNDYGDGKKESILAEIKKKIEQCS